MFLISTGGSAMKKQTVEQRYHEEQMMKGQTIPKELANQAIQTPEQQDIQQLFSSTKEALLAAQQAVHQAQAVHPTQAQLMTTEQRLTHAIQQLQQLQLTNLGVPKGTEQQLQQLSSQINTAAGTLHMIQQATAPQSYG